jgi:uncharacterized protein YjaZ
MIKHAILFILAFVSLTANLNNCFSQTLSQRNNNAKLEDSLKRLPDETKVGGIVIHNLFKNQILAHADGIFDSILIVNKVYRPHQQLWDSCYAMIFGNENAKKFNTTSGMIAWNRTIYPKNKLQFDKLTRQLLGMNLGSILAVNLKKFNSLVKYKPEAEISLLFTPLQGIGFGGCNANQFALELNYSNTDLNYIINQGIPHELNHLAYEKRKIKDPQKGSALAQAIDEGFACYFTWVFFDRKIPQHEVVERMSAAEWQWYLDHEKELFKKLSPYFADKSGNNPLLRNDKHKLFPDAPKTLFYWLGFRIIEAYVNKHGKNSWRDIYDLPIQEVFNKSGIVIK